MSNYYVPPFTILVDTAEQHPFEFQGMKADSKDGYKPILIQWNHNLKRANLGRHPDSYGDYSLDGMHRVIGIERKSVADLQSTVLEFKDGRRDRFEKEMSNLQSIRYGFVVVEGSFQECCTTCRDTTMKTSAQNNKILHRSILSYQINYDMVRWVFCETRRFSEITTFRLLEKCYKHWNDVDARQQEIPF